MFGFSTFLLQQPEGFISNILRYFGTMLIFFVFERVLIRVYDKKRYAAISALKKLKLLPKANDALRYELIMHL